MREQITEHRNPRSVGIDGKTVDEILRIINSEDQLVSAAVAREIPRIAEAVEAITTVLNEGGRVFFIGAGTSGRLGVLESAEMPPTFGVPQESFQVIIAGGPDAVFRSIEGAEDDEAEGRRALDEHGLGRSDVVVALSASGTTPFVMGAVMRAKEKGAGIVAVTCNPGSPAAELADIAITPEVGAEVVAGSTRMKAGSAQKLVLNMLTTAAMIRFGRVYDGYMVGVQPTNRKLKERAKRLVEIIAGVEPGEAERAVERAGGDVRVAVLMVRTGATSEEASRAIAEADGSLRKALEMLR